MFFRAKNERFKCKQNDLVTNDAHIFGEKKTNNSTIRTKNTLKMWKGCFALLSGFGKNEKVVFCRCVKFQEFVRVQVLEKIKLKRRQTMAFS